MNIIALSREVACRSIPNPGCYLISISEPDEDSPRLHNDWEDILYLHFDDIDRECPSIGGRELVLFNKTQAGKILNFVEKYKGSINTLVIHCLAGISRSVGVQVALAKIYLDKDEYKRFPCHNRHVATTILKVHMEEVKDATTK